MSAGLDCIVQEWHWRWESHLCLGQPENDGWPSKTQEEKKGESLTAQKTRAFTGRFVKILAFLLRLDWILDVIWLVLANRFSVEISK